ncbi:hypothetical protein DFH11DRAFT_1734181 [Phellopilus nigrolimitatus]|nr:hypothetical protein DFH11DRAFT_1734181 [Phellopilus nigrolimitatus]
MVAGHCGTADQAAPFTPFPYHPISLPNTSPPHLTSNARQLRSQHQWKGLVFDLGSSHATSRQTTKRGGARTVRDAMRRADAPPAVRTLQNMRDLQMSLESLDLGDRSPRSVTDTSGDRLRRSTPANSERSSPEAAREPAAASAVGDAGFPTRSMPGASPISGSEAEVIDLESDSEGQKNITSSEAAPVGPAGFGAGHGELQEMAPHGQQAHPADYVLPASTAYMYRPATIADLRGVDILELPPSPSAPQGEECMCPLTHSAANPIFRIGTQRKPGCYVVFRGRSVGIFADWDIVQKQVSGVSENCQVGFKAYADAYAALRAAFLAGRLLVYRQGE